MAEDEDGKTEQSAKRLARALEDGQLPLGRDLPLVAGLGASLAALLSLAGPLRSGLVKVVEQAMSSMATTPFSSLGSLVVRPALAAAAVCAAGGAASVLVTLVQTKGRMWPERAAPDLSRVFDPSRLTRLFSKEILTDLGVATAKLVAVAWAAWNGVRGDFLTLQGLLGAAPGEQLARTFAILLRAGWRMLLVTAVIAGVDLALIRTRFMKKMRVTKAEAKRESREEDGDPLLRGKRKQRHRELARGRAKIEVPRADALLVNPTHIAIALRYRKEEGRAPRVMAKGKGALAEYMRDLARENGIPIVEDIPLARLLHRKVKVGREVPPQTYKAVAAVLAFVYRVTGRGPGAGMAA